MDEQHDDQHDALDAAPTDEHELAAETAAELDEDGAEQDDQEAAATEDDSPGDAGGRPRRSRLRAAVPFVLAGTIGLAAGAGIVGLVHGFDGDGHHGRPGDHVEMQHDDQHMPGGH